MPRSAHQKEDATIVDLYLPYYIEKPMLQSFHSVMETCFQQLKLTNSRELTSPDLLLVHFREAFKRNIGLMWTEEELKAYNSATVSSTRSTQLGRETVRHVNFLSSPFLGHFTVQDVSDELKARHILTLLSQELQGIQILQQLATPWVKCIPVLALVTMRIAVAHIGINYWINRADVSLSSYGYDTKYVSGQDSSTRSYIKSAVRGVSMRITEIVEHGCTEFYQDFDPLLKLAPIKRLLKITEDVILPLKDVVPVLACFSWYWDEKIPEAWEQESGEGAGWKWMQPTARMLYEDVSKRSKPAESYAYEAMAKVMEYTKDEDCLHLLRTFAKHELHTAAISYHLVTYIAEENGVEAEDESITSFHDYRAKRLGPQVQAVQFQSSTLQLWKCLSISVEGVVKGIVEKAKKRATSPKSRTRLKLDMDLGWRKCIEQVLQTNYFLTMIAGNEGTVFQSINNIMLRLFATQGSSGSSEDPTKDCRSWKSK